MCKECTNNEVLHNEEYINIQTGEVLDLVRVNQLKDNAMLKVRPDLWSQWNFEKNDELGLDVWKMTKGMEKKVWWICSDCGSDFDAFIYHRTIRTNCPYCAGLKANDTNSLAILNPELTKQWHPVLNGTLTPHNVVCNSNKKRWWICDLGHEWEESPNKRTTGGCPYCSNRRLLVGFNDMWTTNPKQASWLLDPDDGYKYMQSGSQRVDWKCLCCGGIYRNSKINNMNKYDSFPCKMCGDNISYGEKFMFSLLQELTSMFLHNQIQKWSKGRLYDFYAPSLNMIIETHGEQHYIQTNRANARTLKEEQENDKYKYEMAIQNGIKPENYIVIDCRYSDFEFIKNNILNSRLAELFDLSSVDWNNILVKIEKPIIKTIYELWNKGYSISQLIKETRLNVDLIRNNLKNATILGLCDYNSKEATVRGNSKNYRNVVCLDSHGVLVKEYKTLQDASVDNNSKPQRISSACNNQNKIESGFKWMYKEDYEKYIEQQNKVS